MNDSLCQTSSGCNICLWFSTTKLADFSMKFCLRHENAIFVKPNWLLRLFKACLWAHSPSTKLMKLFSCCLTDFLYVRFAFQQLFIQSCFQSTTTFQRWDIWEDVHFIYSGVYSMELVSGWLSFEQCGRRKAIELSTTRLESLSWLFLRHMCESAVLDQGRVELSRITKNMFLVLQCHTAEF